MKKPKKPCAAKTIVTILHTILTSFLICTILYMHFRTPIHKVSQSTQNIDINPVKPGRFQETPKALTDVLKTIQGSARYDIEDLYYMKIEMMYNDHIESCQTMLASTIQKLSVMNGLSLNPDTIVLSKDFYDDLRRHCGKDSQPMIDFCVKSCSDILSCIESINSIKYKRTEISVRKSIANTNTNTNTNNNIIK